ncbi:hypothetical protein N8J89_08120 [Crossiella sp. CA-258035]|uniref:hypothetical protein n=1 Tax=Crossiella sp. CA-258035 TaxID=2981138 RepID=UPI0024BD295C|nr:hypothetical protein [Crossiella sp. CA-258035]WHT21021.1 hypothetical protein N8J89_08120 [Crossiella sp. CA-258035]
MQGTRNTRRKTGNVSNVIDLDALLAKRLLKPVPTVLGGHTYQVRTDLTGAEITEYFSLTGEGKDVEALTLLVGADDAERLNTALADLPQAHMTLVVRKIMTSAGVIRGVPEDADEGSVGEGESSAS